MIDDLVARLRDMCGRNGILKSRDIYDTDVAEAADRIEELEAALRKIADPDSWEGMDWVSYGVPKWIARAALEGRKHNEKARTGMDT
jgi:hypothetical protein